MPDVLLSWRKRPDAEVVGQAFTSARYGAC